ncbi:MAG: hypothetical protein NWE78_03820 [Candidatus Bathyarchaeota archaeon]|nr:hypothetical protein [Candidatus Bathyarchaeota archaeon]
MTRKQNPKSKIERKLVYGILLVSLIILVSLMIYYTILKSSPEGWNSAIVDQLTIQKQLDNPTFKDISSSILNDSGYDTKYFPGDSVTINFLRDLPAKSGKILLLRAHSAVRNDTDWVDIFTSEPYLPGMYTDLAQNRQISKAQMYSFEDWYFAIGPKFINASMRGKFDSDCIIVLMGCNSLNQTSMAKALVGKGARAVIGWTSWIEANYTDTMTLKLLGYLLAKDPYTINEAVNKINYEIAHDSPNPYESELSYYPDSSEVADFKIPMKSTEPLVNRITEYFAIRLLATLNQWKHWPY